MSGNQALRLFHRAAAEIPAYKDYLAKQGCDPSAIHSPDDFRAHVPLTSKKKYLVHYPHRQLMWRADQEGPVLFCSTSGSTGEPYYFPRNERLSWQYSFLIEDYLKYSSYGSGSTLVIVGFGMGVWIGGIITLRAFEIAAERLKRPIAILPTGYNKAEIFKALKRLAPNYQQTILIGYPPFVKELVDDAPAEGIDLKKLNMRFFFAAESFTETFRDYICRGAGAKNPLTDTLNVYGSADIGAMACETPLSILVRRLVMDGNPMLRKAIFRQIEKTPTLAQYSPDFIHFEEVDGEVVLTGDAALPLIRYAIGDHGGVFDYEFVEAQLDGYGIDLVAEITKAGIGPSIDKNKPFVFVYERTDLAATLQGLLIYPEYIKETLLGPEMQHFFTERFTMSTKYDIHHNQFLQINLELHKDVKSSVELKKQALLAIHKGLVARSSEFAEVAKTRSTHKLLQVVLWENGHPRYFAPGTKQKWVEKP